MNKTIYILLVLLLISACQRNEVIRTHGISYLEKREKLIIVEQSNKNDALTIFGHPSTKGMTDDNLWIYVERTRTRGKLLKFGRNYLKKNNVLVLEFDKYGVLKKKEFYNKDDMNNIKVVEATTEGGFKRNSFIYDFMSSMKQKINDPLGQRAKKRQEISQR